jgi:putative hydrolase of the HAD superfamily
MIDAVLFDLDETLLDRTTSLQGFLADQFDRHGQILGSVNFADWRDRFLALDQRGHVHKKMVYPAILTEFGGDAAAEHSLFSDYELRCSAFAIPFDGMAETLHTIRALGLPMGIVTNGETDFQTRHIEALGLDDLVQTVLISQREGLRKPAPDLFLRAANRLNVSPSRCLFVGDNPVADILGAAATGMKTAWFHGNADWPMDLPVNPGEIIDKLGDILGLLQGSTGLSARACFNI